MTHLTNGTKVQYRPNSEPYVFSRNPEAVRTICSIRLICDDESGRVTHSYAKLLGRTNEVFTHDLMGVKDVIADGALPVAVSVATEHGLLTRLETRLADEVLDLARALHKFSAGAQAISKELPFSAQFGKNVTLFLSLCSLHVAAALLQRPDLPLLADDGAQQLKEVGLSLNDFIREVDLDGRRFLAIALVDEQAANLHKAAQAGNAG